MFAFVRKATPWAAGLVSIVSVWSSAASAEATADQKRLQQEWWQWVMAIPSSDSPVYDKTGNRCGVGQRGDVWFLAGSTGGKITRKCTVPKGVRLLVPVVNNFCFPDAAYTDGACTTDTIEFINGFATGTLLLEVDGTAVTPIPRVQDTSDFTFAVGANGYGGVKPGIYRATVADGYWALLDPLPTGKRTIHIAAQGPTFSLDVTYILDVVESTN